MAYDPRTQRIYAAVNSYHWGPAIRWTLNLGSTWEQPKEEPRFEKETGLTLERLWHIEPGRPDEPETLYLGVDPANLFKSEDDGQTWGVNAGLLKHPTRGRWGPGNGGLCLHSVLLDPRNAKRLYVGISAAGVFRTEDGGESWTPINKGVRVDFLPDKYPEVGQCVHKIATHPDRSDMIYNQDHCGTYRLDQNQTEWTDVSEGLPSRFGFPIAVNPNNPETIYVVPLDDGRLSPKGEFAVYRSENGGKIWQRKTKGLPSRNAYLTVLREAMTTDQLDPAGIYIGTTTGQLYYSKDDGDSWRLLAEWLPRILSVTAATIT